MSKFYLKILTLSNIVMLNIAELFLKLGIQTIPNIIIKQCQVNSEYIEGCL